MHAAAVREGQQAAQSSFQEPQAVVEGLVNEGRRLFEGASQTAQRAAEGGKETLDQAMQQVLLPITFRFSEVREFLNAMQSRHFVVGSE